MNGKRIFLSAPHLFGNEERYIAEAVKSGYIAPAGPMLEKFEKCVSSHLGDDFTSVATTGATIGLKLLFDALGIGKGDFVAVSDLTFVASVAPAVQLGAVPVFIDSLPGSWTMDPGALESTLKEFAAKGKRISAVVAVDLYGHPCDYPSIEAACKKYGAVLIEDAAEALGALYEDGGVMRKAGSAGDASVFSFNGNKIVTSSGGGSVQSKNASLAQKVRFLSRQAKDPCPWYEHSRLGYNGAMSNILAAIGLAQMELLEKKIARRKEICAIYRERLPEFAFPPPLKNTVSNYWLTAALLPADAKIAPVDIVRALGESGIEARPVWKPMHMQPVFSGACVSGDGENSSELFRRGICLPSGDGLDDGDIARVCGEVRKTVFG